MFAVSVLLVYVARVRTPSQSPTVVRVIEMAIEILDAMDESVVARKSSEIIRHSLKEARGTTIDAVCAPNNQTIPAPNSQLYGQDFGFANMVSVDPTGRCKFTHIG
jgi:hypothetical protein